MNKNITPVYSSIARKNVYDYYDPELKTTTKVAGFLLDVFDNIRGTRIRKRVKVDYKTAELMVDKIKKAIDECDLDKIDKIAGVQARSLDDLVSAFISSRRKNSNRVGGGISELTIRRYVVSAKSMLRHTDTNTNDVQVS